MAKQSSVEKVFTINSPIWHPFNIGKSPSIFVDKAKEATLYLADGNQIIDAISSWWVVTHGHNEETIQQAIINQIENLSHVLLADFIHQPAYDLAKILLELLGHEYVKVFYSDNGSTAVETAIKMVLQAGESDFHGKKIVAFRGGYHGDTFGAMSVSERSIFSKPFTPWLFEVDFIDPPNEQNFQRTLDQLMHLIKQQKVAALIFEPLLQGAAGMRSHSLEGLDECLRICQESGVYTIADEVMTGCGRLGPNFACDLLRNKPDIICLAKGLTGGFLPLSATICNQRIADNLQKPFLHGHSYCGNPLGCAAALASLRLLVTEESMNKRRRISLCHQKFLDAYQDHPALTSIRAHGTILSIEYAVSRSGYTHPIRERLGQFFFERRIYVRPIGNCLYIMPPYCITESQLKTIYQVIAKSLENFLCN